MVCRVRDVPGCRGCPLYQDGSQNFVPDELVPGAPVMVVGQNPGQEEEAKGQPFVGATGRKMEGIYFKIAGLVRGQNVSIGNALRCRWQGGNELPPLEKAEAQAALSHCREAHFRLPSATRLIVAQGAYALWSLAGEGDSKGNRISDWRGWVLPYGKPPGVPLETVWTPSQYPANIPVLVTLHLSALNHNPAMTLPTQMDWAKVPKILSGKWPEPLPTIHLEPPAKWPQIAAFDTEFDEAGRLVRYSLATPDRRVYVVEASDINRVTVPESAIVILWNAPADIDHLRAILGASPQIEDGMLAHSVLWPGPSEENLEAGEHQKRGMPHGLAFVGSLSARINRWKHLGPWGPNPIEYSAGDALGTWDAWVDISQELDRDPESRWIYEQTVRPLIPILMRSKAMGLRVNQERVQQVAAELEYQAEQASLRAQAAAGFPLNLASGKQVGDYLYKVEKLNLRKLSKLRRAKRG